jgi:hypothetical protein
MTSSQNAINIVGDIEYFGCGCYTVVDLKTGQGKVHYVCDKHRAVSWHIIQSER